MILKVYWKGDIRRLPVLNPDESLDDMIRRIRRVFSIPYEEDITLTYCDQGGCFHESIYNPENIFVDCFYYFYFCIYILKSEFA